MRILGQLATNERFFRAPASFVDAVARALPEGARFEPCESMDEFRAKLPDATGVVGWPFASAWLRKAPRLRFVHLLTAGVPEGLESAAATLALTSSAGANARSVAEHALFLLLSAARGLSVRGLSSWDAETFRPARPLASMRVVVGGYGPIGQAFAGLAAPLVGALDVVSRQARRDGERVVHGFDALPGLASKADAIVLALPNRPETRALFDAGFLGVLRNDVALVNVARGALLDEGALLAFLDAHPDARYLADVAVPEPYPDDGALRAHASVILTPHVAGRSVDVWQALTEGTVKALHEALRACEARP